MKEVKLFLKHPDSSLDLGVMTPSSELNSENAKQDEIISVPIILFKNHF